MPEVPRARRVPMRMGRVGLFFRLIVNSRKALSILNGNRHGMTLIGLDLNIGGNVSFN